jgi:hypothetical protein
MSITNVVSGMCIAYLVFMFAMGIIFCVDFIRTYPGLKHYTRSIIITVILFSAVYISLIPYIIIGHVAVAMFHTEFQMEREISKRNKNNSKLK